MPARHARPNLEAALLVTRRPAWRAEDRGRRSARASSRPPATSGHDGPAEDAGTSAAARSRRATPVAART